MGEQLRSVRRQLPGGRLLALVCIAALVAVGAAAAGTDKKPKPKPKPKPAPVGAVYTETNNPAGNSVVVFNRFATGVLKLRQTVSTHGNGSIQATGCGPGCPILDSVNEVVVSANGKLVFAVNAGSNSVSSFQVTKTGLKFVSSAPSGGVTPESLALHGTLLYVLNVATGNANGTTGNIYGLRVSADGHLTALGSSQPLAHAAPPDHSADPRALGFDPSGKVVVATEIAGGFMGPGPPGAIDTFVIDANGQAAPVVSHPSSAPFPFGFAIDSRGQMVVTNVVNPDPKSPTIGSVSSYNLSDSGDLTPVDTKSSGGILPCWVVITNDQRVAYVVNTGAGAPALLTGFGLSPQGALTPLSPQTSPRSGEFVRTDAALSRDSKYLYVLSPSFGPPGTAPSHIDEYRRASNGSLTFIGSTGAGANLGPGATGLAAS
jgi:6-phosphogluconolactonase